MLFVVFLIKKTNFSRAGAYLLIKIDMKTTTTIYKIGDQFLLSRQNLFNKVKEQIDEFFINNLKSSVELEGNFPFESLQTDLANVQNIGSVTIPVHDFMIVDNEHQSIDTDVKILIDLSLNIQEGIIDGKG